jgi:hypothetical protein
MYCGFKKYFASAIIRFLKSGSFGHSAVSIRVKERYLMELTFLSGGSTLM